VIKHFGFVDLLKHSLYETVSKTLFRNGVNREINGYAIRFPLEFSRFYPSNSEPEKFEFIRRFAKGNALDLGAHIGLYSVLLARQCESVLCFEPSNLTRVALLKTLEYNNCKNVEVRSECVTDETGEIDFYDTGSRASNANSIAPIGKRLTLKSVRIDDLNKDFDFIKIDIEGAELLALRGAKRTLKKVSHLTCEIHPNLLEKIGQSSKDIFDFLSQYNPKYFYDGRLVVPSDLQPISHQYELNIILNQRSV
jgi:FkbM family methyltransferase